MHPFCVTAYPALRSWWCYLSSLTGKTQEVPSSDGSARTFTGSYLCLNITTVEEQKIKVDDLECNFWIFTVKYPGNYGVTSLFESVRMYMNEVE